LQKQASVDLHRPIEPQLVAFTGTPLLKDDKTQNKFGPILHAYTMQRAVEQVWMVQLGGLEPPTFGATIRRSNQLSYSCTRGAS
jgi:hypothetical protein